MVVKLKFICCRYVEFRDKQTGQKVCGYIPYVLNEETDEIIKCRMQENGCPDFNLGDDCSVNVRIRGRYASYIFNNSK